MPTPMSAFARVAGRYGVDINDVEAIDAFFEKQFPQLAEPEREQILEELLSVEAQPESQFDSEQEKKNEFAKLLDQTTKKIAAFAEKKAALLLPMPLSPPEEEALFSCLSWAAERRPDIESQDHLLRAIARFSLLIFQQVVVARGSIEKKGAPQTHAGATEMRHLAHLVRHFLQQERPIEETSEFSSEIYQVLRRATRSYVELPSGLLTERQALVLRLRYDVELDSEKIADLLDVDPRTVRRTHHQALLKLRKYFTEAKE